MIDENLLRKEIMEELNIDHPCQEGSWLSDESIKAMNTYVSMKHGHEKPIKPSLDDFLNTFHTEQGFK